MSVPFSSTHLRVPRGFGTILEGLTREVLRDQPEDIPTYAAQYFEALLKQREESGMDPAEWTSKLEDRFYNNHAFKNIRTSPEREKTPEMNISKFPVSRLRGNGRTQHKTTSYTWTVTKKNHLSPKLRMNQVIQQNSQRFPPHNLVSLNMRLQLKAQMKMKKIIFQRNALFQRKQDIQ
ncbi:sperm surface protein Sp17-like [Melanotaenia boesemani]|uniref:sperm surface protein Sp17-like n=1 Tax=Melanotaenia boesemani TaxID=1250792 RepID=UPI001C054B60|nr:sperm surface protein Sp17-like [Melanotaenia boesemani]